MLQAACARLSESGDDDQDKLLSTSARQLLGPARAVEQALADAAAGAEDAARESETDAARAAEKLSLAEKAHDDAAARLATARKRHATAQARFGRDLMALPALVRDLIPASTPAVTPGDIDTATADHRRTARPARCPQSGPRTSNPGTREARHGAAGA